MDKWDFLFLLLMLLCAGIIGAILSAEITTYRFEHQAVEAGVGKYVLTDGGPRTHFEFIRKDDKP